MPNRAQPIRHDLKTEKEHAALLYHDFSKENIAECMTILHIDVIDTAINTCHVIVVLNGLSFFYCKCRKNRFLEYPRYNIAIRITMLFKQLRVLH